MTQIIELSKRIRKMDIKILKSNLKQIINQKYNERGWRKEVAELLNLNINTFNAIVNQANCNKISMEQLLEIINILELDIEEVLNANNKVIKSSIGRYGKISNDIKWTDKLKEKFLMEYNNPNNNKETIAKKYNLTQATASVYSTNFGKGRKKKL